MFWSKGRRNTGEEGGGAGGHSHLRIIREFLRIFITVRSEDDPSVRIKWPEEQSRMVPTRVVMKVYHQTPSGEEFTRLRIA